MKNLIRNSVLSLFAVAATVTFGVVPPVNVTVSDAGGKAAFKGATDRSGAFATGSLKPGNYIVQFRSNDAALKGKNYSVVVSAGKKKVSANAVAGEKFANGGVAVKVDVTGVMSITGQVAADTGGGPPIGTNGKPMVWIGKTLGSNLPAHWAESDSAEAKHAMTAGSMSTRDLQNRQDQGVSPNSVGN